MKLEVVGSGSSGNSYILTDAERMLILDAGCKFQEIQRAAKFNVLNIDGCLITHSHMDHCEYVGKVAKTGVDCATGVKSVQPIYEATGCVLKPLSERTWNRIGKWSVMPLEVNHDVPCYGFIIVSPTGGTLFYGTDFSYIGHNGKEVTLKGLNINHWLIAINYTGSPDTENDNLNGHIYSGHSSLEYIKQYLAKSITDRCKTIIACHLSSRNSDAEQVKKELVDLFPQCQIGIASKGESFNL